jgi:hypothetical protein
MVLQPVHELIPRGRVRGGLRLIHAGRPAFLRWSSDILFHYYLSTACRSPFIRSWKFASFTDRIVLLCPVIYRWPPCATSHTPAILIVAARRRCSSSDAHTNQSAKPHSGSFYNWLLLSIRVVVAVSCQIAYATARYWNIRTLPCVSTTCQDDM